MKRTTEVDIAEMRSRGFDSATIAKAELDLILTNRADELCRQIEHAFADVTLGDGIGLWEAQGLDDRDDERKCLAYRARDEKWNWKTVPVADLNACNSSPSFLDAAGFRFYLPAFMCAELRDEHGYGFEFTLVQIDVHGGEKFSLLSPPQRAAVRSYLEFLVSDPEYGFERDQITRALKEYWTEESCASR